MDGDTLATPAGEPSSVSRTSRILVPADVRDALKRGGSAVGKFICVRELGRGGMGVVYQAWDPDLGRWVALKLIKGAGEEHEIARFLREAQTSASLIHPNIAQVYEAADSPVPYLAIQYIDGRCASDLDPKKLSVTRAAEIVRDAALGLEFAHAQGVIHRDMKPHNVMVGKDGRVFVLDFGLAKSLNAESSMSVSGALVGTPNFMSPEQAKAQRNLTPVTDVYSLGATLYYLLTGKPPCRGRSLQETLDAVVNREPGRPSTDNPRVPPDLDAITLRALEKDPRRRYRSAKALADDLQRFLLGEQVSAYVPGPAVRLVRWAKRNRGLAAAMGGGLLLAAALVVTLFVSAARDRQRERDAAALEARKNREALDLVRRQADVERVGLQIAQWRTVLHNPPHSMEGDDRRLEALLRELEALGRLEGLPEATARLHRGTALAYLDRSEDAVRELRAALDALREAAKKEGREFDEEASLSFHLGEELSRMAAVLRVKARLLISEEGRRERLAKAEEFEKESIGHLKAALKGKRLDDRARTLARLAVALREAGNDAGALDVVLRDAQDLGASTQDPRALELAATAAERKGQPLMAAGLAGRAARILESSSYHARLAGTLMTAALGDVRQPNRQEDLRPLFDDGTKWLRTALVLRPGDVVSAEDFGSLADRYYWYCVHFPLEAPEDLERCLQYFRESRAALERIRDAQARAGRQPAVYRLANNALHEAMIEANRGQDPTARLKLAKETYAILRRIPGWKGPDTECGWVHITQQQWWLARGQIDLPAFEREAEECERLAAEGGEHEDVARQISMTWFKAAMARSRAQQDAGEAVRKALRWADRSIELKEDYVDGRIHRANLRLEVGDRAGAIQDFKRILELQPGREDVKRVLAQLGG